jgi:hypothetical protein
MVVSNGDGSDDGSDVCKVERMVLCIVEGNIAQVDHMA